MNDLKNLYKLNFFSRVNLLKQYYPDAPFIDQFTDLQSPSEVLGDCSIENFVGYMPIPCGFVYGVPINGKKKNIVMSVEESSVIAALNHAAKLFREDGEIIVHHYTRSVTGQIAFSNDLLPEDCDNIRCELIENILREEFPRYFERNGSVLDWYKTRTRDFTLYHLKIDALQAMGANLVTQMCEAISRYLSQVLNYPKALMCIVSNATDEPHLKVEATLKINRELGKDIQAASMLAEQNSFRAATHNKGIMNAIDPVVMISGNDWRANNAVLHHWASRSGRYKPLSTWRYNNSTLVGEMEIPLQIGTVGGMVKIHPVSKMAMHIMQISNSEELSEVIVVSGLLQNFAALKSLVTSGIVAGHMRLHVKNIALEKSSNEGERAKLEADLIKLLEEKKTITHSDADKILASYEK